VWTVDATTNAILELADYLVGLRAGKVVLESTNQGLGRYPSNALRYG